MTGIILFSHSVRARWQKANFPVPVLTTGELFYLRQVWVYNMGIYSCKTGNTKMYVYDETAGKKGSNGRVSLLKHSTDKYI
jgi:hypothetical protein